MCHTEKMKVVKTMVPGLLLSTLPLCSASPWTATPPPFSQHVGLYVLMGDVVVERLDVRGMCNIGKLQNLNSKNPSPPCRFHSVRARSCSLTRETITDCYHPNRGGTCDPHGNTVTCNTGGAAGGACRQSNRETFLCARRNLQFPAGTHRPSLAGAS